MPWINVSTIFGGDYRVCCFCKDPIFYLREDGKKHGIWDEDPLEFRNSKTAKKVRIAMKNNIRLPECSPCWEAEDMGHKSKRQSMLERYEDVMDELVENTDEDGHINVDKTPIMSYDIRMSNLCNCNCLMCDSNIMSRGGKLISWKPEYSEKFLDTIKNNTHATELKFLGGEPLIMPKCWDLVDALIEKGTAKNINLYYTTNGRILDKEMIDRWKEFKSVRITFSIDAIGEKLSQIRPPTKWEEIESSLEIFEKETTDNITGNISVTVTKLNLFHIPELLDWFIKRNFKKIVTVNTNMLRKPEHYSIANKQHILDKVREIYNHYLTTRYDVVVFAESIIRHMENEK